MNYTFKYFSELSGIELYNIYFLRCLVFVVEQNCPYQEVDKNDLLALHVLQMDEKQLIAYARILPPDAKHPFPRIGRVVVHPDFRGKKRGQALMKTSIEKSTQLFPGLDICISAQSHLKTFYSELGFVAEGAEYLEDNIPHIAMRWFSTSTQIA